MSLRSMPIQIPNQKKKLNTHSLFVSSPETNHFHSLNLYQSKSLPKNYKMTNYKMTNENIDNVPWNKTNDEEYEKINHHEISDIPFEGDFTKSSSFLMKLFMNVGKEMLSQQNDK